MPETTTTAPRLISNGSVPAGISRFDPVSMTVRLETTSIPASGVVSGVLDVENQSDRVIDITHPSGCDIGFGLFFDGQLVSMPMGCTAAVSPDSLQPRERRTFDLRIEAADGEGNALPPGTYDVFAGLDVYGETEGGTWWASAMPVDIE